MKRWFFWYILPFGAREWAAAGPEHLTDYDAFQLEFRTKSQRLGAQMYRFVYDERGGIWIYDSRSDRQLLAGAPLSLPIG